MVSKWLRRLACVLPLVLLQGSLFAQAELDRIRELHDRLQLAPRDSFLNYAIATLARQGDIDLKREGIDFPLVPLTTDDPARRVDLFRLSSGALALHESLQLSELLGPPRNPSTETVPLSELDPPDLPSLPFEEMVKEYLETHGADSIRVDEEARFVPHDWCFLRFKSGADLHAFFMEADTWIRHTLVYYGWDARDRDLLLCQLGRLRLPDPRKLPLLYQALPGPIVVTMSDLFLREGTDVTIILPETVPASFFMREDQDAVQGRNQWMGRLELSGKSPRIVLSTSKKALDRVIAAGAEGAHAKGELGTGALAKSEPGTGALADSADYRYMRTLLPVHGEESAFVFLSDAFLRRLVGPRLRILESRRIRCASHLRTQVNAALLHALEEGQPPESLAVLKEKGYLDEANLRCPHGGEYTLARGHEPCCSVHRGLDNLIPHLELDLTEADEGEAWAYRRFSRSYQNFWRRFFDPVGISMKREGRSWAVDIEVLPLADNSLYRNLARVVGGVPTTKAAPFMAPSTIFMLSARIDRSFLKDVDWRAFRSGLIPWDEIRKEYVAGFGNNFFLGLIDDELLFDFDLSAFAGDAVQRNRAAELMLVPILGAANLPAYAVIPVEDPVRAERCLDMLHEGLLRQGRRPEGGRFSLKYESYGLKGGPVKVASLEFHSFKIRLFYLLQDKALVVATRPDVLAKVLAGAAPAETNDPSNVALTLFPEQWNAIRPDMLLGYEEGARKICALNLVELQPFADANLEDAKRILGMALECPDGCGYTQDDKGDLQCALHGSSAFPRQGAVPAEANPVNQLLMDLGEIRFSMRYTEHGIHTRITVKR